ncbi:MAG: type II secretion system protein GspG [Phycisphaerales bacterium]|nr:type II secretion system protein GspG [Planctomycetota bacterium]
MKNASTTATRPAPSALARGFSLLELTLVLVILGVLMAVAAYNVLGQGEKAKATATRATLATIKNAIAQYHLEQSAYPPDLQTLVTAKILEAGKLSDGWKRPLVYDPAGPSPEQPFILFSRGPDGQSPSADDISAFEAVISSQGN